MSVVAGHSRITKIYESAAIYPPRKSSPHPLGQQHRLQTASSLPIAARLRDKTPTIGEVNRGEEIHVKKVILETSNHHLAREERLGGT
jgi:hypothetical protein